MVARRWQNEQTATDYQGLTMTADDFLALGETDRKCELVHGVVLMSPSAGFFHQSVLGELVGQMQPFVRAGKLGAVLTDFDVRISRSTVYEPDLLFVSHRKLGGRRGPLDFPPDIVVEILSPGAYRKDLETKLNDYQSFGVPEYWVFNPGAGEAMFLRLRVGVYVEVASPEDGLTDTTYTTDILPGFSLDLHAIRSAMRGE